MPNVATVTLPWPPSVNHYWRHRIAGPKGKQFIQIYISKEGTAYREAVRATVLRRWPGLSKPLTQRLAVKLTVMLPDRRARDLDNLGKAILDSLTHSGVYADDSLIDRLEFVRGDVVGKPGRVDVEITPLA